MERITQYSSLVTRDYRKKKTQPSQIIYYRISCLSLEGIETVACVFLYSCIHAFSLLKFWSQSCFKSSWASPRGWVRKDLLKTFAQPSKRFKSELITEQPALDYTSMPREGLLSVFWFGGGWVAVLGLLRTKKESLHPSQPPTPRFDHSIFPGFPFKGQPPPFFWLPSLFLPPRSQVWLRMIFKNKI